MKRTIGLFALALGLALSMAEPSQAHYVKKETIVYDDGYYCLPTWVEASHGSYGNGYLKAEIKFRKRGTPPGCFTYLYFEAGNARIDAEWWRVPSGTGYKCKDYGLKYAPVRTHTYSRQFSIPSIYCGNGYYQTFALLQVKINGSWEGAWVASGRHLYPTTLSPAEIAAEGIVLPPWPEWIDPVTHIVDRSKLPPELADQFVMPEG